MEGLYIRVVLAYLIVAKRSLSQKSPSVPVVSSVTLFLCFKLTSCVAGAALLLVVQDVFVDQAAAHCRIHRGLVLCC